MRAAIRRLTGGAAVALAATAALVGSLPGTASAIDTSPRHPWNATLSTNAIQVGGTYTPIVGNFAAGGGDDIIWYSPGAGADSIWISTSIRGTFTKLPMTINGSYRPIVGDFGGDSADDILWYAPGIAADPLWIAVSGSDMFERRTVKVAGWYQPVVLDLSLQLTASMHGTPGPFPKDAILWYAPGSGADTLWSFNSDGTHGSAPAPIEGSPQLFPMAWGTDTLGDVLAYTPGSGPDAVYEYDTGVLRKTTRTVNGTYQPQILGNGYVDSVVWLGPGAATDALWYNNEANGVVSLPSQAIVGTRVVPTSWNSADGYVYDPDGPDKTYVGGYALGSLDPDVGPGAMPVLGDFDGDLGPDALFYVPGSGRERLGYGTGPT